MILESLILENIRSYRHAEIMFPKGIILFKGDIGSGKSSILMAVEFALFGFGTMDPESILAKKAHMGRVELGFTVNGEKYEIRRQIERKKNRVGQDSKNSYIRVNGEKEPLSATELKQRVLGILGFNESPSPKSDSRIYRYAVFTPQEEMKAVLKSKAERREMIRRAFGIEEYSRAAANSAVLAGAVRNQAVRFEERSRGMAEAEEQNISSKRRIEEIDSEIAGVRKKADAAEAERKGHIREMSELQKKQVEAGRIQARKKQLEDLIEDHRNRVQSTEAEIEEIEGKKAAAAEELAGLDRGGIPTKRTSSDIQKEIEDIAEARRIQTEEKTKLEAFSQRLEGMGGLAGKSSAEESKKADELQEEMSNLGAQEGAMAGKIEDMKRQKTEKKTLISTWKESIADFERLGSKCPRCKMDIDAAKMGRMKDGLNADIKKAATDVEDITSKIQEMESTREGISHRIEESRTDLENHRRMIDKIREYEDVSKAKSDMEKSLAKANAEYDTLKDRSGCGDSDPIKYLVRLKEDLAEYGRIHTRATGLEESIKNHEGAVSKHQEMIKDLNAGIVSSKTELEDARMQMEGFAGLDHDMESTRDRLEKAEQDARDAGRRLGSLEQSRDDEARRIEENDKKIGAAKDATIQHKRFAEHHDWLREFFGMAAGRIEKEVMLSILRDFDEAYQKWYATLIDDPTKESRINEDFAPVVTQDGFDQDVDFLSGGERTSIALAYRLTLNSLIRREVESLRSNLLILDEPTDGFSRDHLSRIKYVLDDLGSEQIILVSHESELEAYVDRVFRVTKENGTSNITPLQS